MVPTLKIDPQQSAVQVAFSPAWYLFFIPFLCVTTPLTFWGLRCLRDISLDLHQAMTGVCGCHDGSRQQKLLCMGPKRKQKITKGPNVFFFGGCSKWWNHLFEFIEFIHVLPFWMLPLVVSGKRTFLKMIFPLQKLWILTNGTQVTQISCPVKSVAYQPWLPTASQLIADKGQSPPCSAASGEVPCWVRLG